MKIQNNLPILTLRMSLTAWSTKQNTHTQQNARFTAYLHLPFKQIPPFRQDTEVQAKQNKKYQIWEFARGESFSTTTTEYRG
jgi:hypothetical protein